MCRCVEHYSDRCDQTILSGSILWPFGRIVADGLPDVSAEKRTQDSIVSRLATITAYCSQIAIGRKKLTRSPLKPRQFICSLKFVPHTRTIYNMEHTSG